MECYGERRNILCPSLPSSPWLLPWPVPPLPRRGLCLVLNLPERHPQDERVVLFPARPLVPPWGGRFLLCKQDCYIRSQFARLLSESQDIVDRRDELLLRAKIAFRGLDRAVTQQELDLFQMTTALPTEPSRTSGAGPTARSSISTRWSANWW
jgi:hypothetical protein